MATTRERRRTPQPGEPLPVVEGKHYVRLLRGRIYHLCGSPEIAFKPGEAHEVPKATFDHLAQHAVDTISFTDPELGTVRRTVAKFEFSPPVPAQPDVVVGW